MKTMRRQKLFVGALICVAAVASVHAQTMPAQIVTPDRVETSIGTLTYIDGAPSCVFRTKMTEVSGGT